ncbi:hypothetical protein SUGI_0836140, partial [Cryptomeria japonica]
MWKLCSRSEIALQPTPWDHFRTGLLSIQETCAPGMVFPAENITTESWPSFSLSWDWKNGLTGGIPSELGRLEKLQFLGLQSNKLGSQIPAALGNCSSLEVLFLGDNSLTGNIPPELGNLKQLGQLSLYGPGNLTGTIPPEIGNCTNLEWLDVGTNLIYGPLPMSITMLPLSTISLLGNAFEGRLPEGIFSMTQLTYLSLGSNKFSGNIPKDSIGELKNLTQLAIYSNNISRAIPESIRGLISLQKLDVSDNRLIGQIPQSIGNCKSITDL